MEIVGGAPPSAERIAEGHERLLARLRAAAETNGHDPGRLRIVGVTKGHAVETCRAALEAGLSILGENRIQEAEPKVAALPGAEWHLVGHLQSNKARRAVRAFAAIHSVDSLGLLQKLTEIGREEGHAPTLLLQVNVSGDEAKSGMSPAELLASEMVEASRKAGVAGLMTIAPMGASEQEARAVFAGLRELRNRLEQAVGMVMPELSMGMSADAEAAAAEGATLVRIGTALFGPRA